MTESETTSKETKDWIYRSSSKRLLMALLMLACAASVAAELLVGERHAKFGIDGFFGFYALLGFISCTVMIFLAKILGFVLKAPTDYYGDTEANKKEDSLS